MLYFCWESIREISRSLGEALGFSGSLGLEIQARLGFVAFTSWLDVSSGLVIFLSDVLGFLG
jgi:hypothetical protein